MEAPSSARRIKSQQCDANFAKVSERGGNWPPGADSLHVMFNLMITTLSHEHAVTSWEGKQSLSRPVMAVQKLGPKMWA